MVLLALGTATTKLALFPAQAEQVVIELGDTRPDLPRGTVDVYTIVRTTTAERRTVNNEQHGVAGLRPPSVSIGAGLGIEDPPRGSA